MFFWVVWLFCKYLNRLKIPESSVPAEIQLQPRFCPWIQPSQCFQFNQGFVDPNTSNLYPDPAFWSNLNPDQDPIPGLCYKLWRKKIKNNFREKQLSLQIFFIVLVNWVSELWIYVLNLTFAPLRIRIHNTGSNKTLSKDSCNTTLNWITLFLCVFSHELKCTLKSQNSLLDFSLKNS